MRRISCVLVANRGEIVVRVCRTLRRLGIRSVAVVSPQDATAVHPSAADEVVAVPDYLDAGALVAAAQRAGADAVHPGYGFLSEDPAFARAVADAGLCWIGPPPQAVEQMGDKVRAKAAAAAAGVPVLPGAGGPGVPDDALAAAAVALGLPVLVKPAAGGGGKGMHRVASEDGLRPAIAAARREAAGAFGDDTLFVERWLDRPHHIEVQVLADAHGTVVDLGERECSLQRRHQKLVEEAPAPALDEPTRRAMAASARAVARACGYVGAGTVEFLLAGDRPGEYFFLEMNTRLQVEHPVTEAVFGIDLVEWQLRVARGEPLPKEGGTVPRRGHAIEARVYAEDPGRGFLPAAGTVLALDEPSGLPGVRVDAAWGVGQDVGTRYDPLMAKVVAWGDDRRSALDRLQAALRATTVLGTTTNVAFLQALLDHPDVVAGRLDTGLVERSAPGLVAGPERAGPEGAEPSGARPEGARAADAAVAAACRVVADLAPAGPVVDPWDLPDGWRVGAAAPTVVHLRRDGAPLVVTVCGPLAAAEVTVGDGAARAAAAALDGDRLTLALDGVTARWLTAVAGDEVWVGREGAAWRFALGPAAGERPAGEEGSGGPVRSPMPGTVAAVHVAVGDRVTAGQPLVAVEAMKMEHVVVAPVDGAVVQVAVRVGQTVALDEPLAEVATGDGSGHREEA